MKRKNLKLGEFKLGVFDVGREVVDYRSESGLWCMVAKA